MKLIEVILCIIPFGLYKRYSNLKKEIDRYKEIIGDEKFIDNIRSLKIKSNSDFSKLEAEYDAYRQIKDNHGNVEEKLSKYENLEKFKEACLAKIGDEEDMFKVQKLKEHGNWENIYKKLNEYEETKKQILKLEAENNSSQNQLRELKEFKTLCLEKIGDTKTIDKMSLLKKYGDMENIFEKLEGYEYCKKQSEEMENLKSLLIDSEDWLEKFKQKINIRNEKILKQNTGINENIKKLGDGFENECLTIFKGKYGELNNAWKEINWKPQQSSEDSKTRKDVEVEFATDNGKFKVNFELKSIQKYYELDPIVINPTIDEEVKKNIHEQIKKAKKQQEKINHKFGLNFIVLSVNTDRFSELEINPFETEGTLIIGQDMLPIILSMLKAITSSFKPEIPVLEEIKNYSNPEYIEMLKELLNSLEMIMPNSKKIELLENRINGAETEISNAKKYFKFMKETSEKAEKIIKEHLTKAKCLSQNEKILEIPEHIESSRE